MKAWLPSQLTLAALVAAVAISWQYSSGRSLTEDELWLVRGRDDMCKTLAEDCNNCAVHSCGEHVLDCLSAFEVECPSGDPDGPWYRCDAAPPMSGLNCTPGQNQAQNCMKTWNCEWDDEDECIKIDSTLNVESFWKSVHITGDDCV